MKEIKLSWLDFKANVDSTKLGTHFFIKNKRYYIHAFNGPIHLSTELDFDNVDAPDFEVNYKPFSNKRSVEQPVKIQEEPVNAETSGTYQAHGFKLDIPTGLAGDWSSMDITFDFNISLLSASWHTPAINDNDLVEFYIAPNTTTGVLTQNANAGDTVLNVSQTVVDNIERGFYIRLTDGVNTELDIKVLGYDKINKTITLKSGIINSYLSATPTYVQQTVKMIDDIWLTDGEEASLGTTSIGGSYITAGTILRIKYKNMTAQAKTFKFIMEYKY